jgi:hypothetical protein
MSAGGGGGGAQGMAVSARVSMDSHGKGSGPGAEIEAGHCIVGGREPAGFAGSEGGVNMNIKTIPVQEMKGIFSADVDASFSEGSSMLSAYTGNLGTASLGGEISTAPGYDIPEYSGIGKALGTKASVIGMTK